MAPKSPRSLTGEALVGGSESRRWRLPIAYRAIPTAALAIDLVIIVIAAVGAELLYQDGRSAFEGEFSHTIAAAVFVAVLFVAAM
ncbi:MAG TPA: hypothetical protein VEH77_04815, partial [Roseiarcus sp.]|nr:hypothetical protein [Roseiarcus sp.]